MGYSTEFNLEVRGVQTKDDFDRLAAALELKRLMYYAFDVGHYDERNHSAFFYCWSPIKWYDYEKSMLEVSIMFPEFTFKLSGNGEMPDDLWEEYFKCDESEYCPAEITFPKPQVIDWDGVGRCA